MEFDPRRCKWLWNTFPVCVDDYVEIFPRGMRSLISITGRVIGLGDSALVLETDNNNIAIRYSEIRMIRKIHKKKQEQEKTQ
ncbi:MAG: hypothetical protein DRO40_08590 [Thermoprotei archaeon]|nr:MAG: hypothetical protein DRO40_08590 [Thermoprotei archaeon]